MKRPTITTPSWLTARADAASLPALAERLGNQIDISTVDELWLFPTRRALGVESTVFVLSIHVPDDRRSVVTAHMRVTRNKRGEPTVETRLDEHATAPPERLPRVIEGVLERLSDDYAATPPSSARIDGRAERWRAMIEALVNAKPNDPLPDVLIPASDAHGESDDAPNPPVSQSQDL